MFVNNGSNTGDNLNVTWVIAATGSILCVAGWLIGIGTGQVNETGMETFIFLLTFARNILVPLFLALTIFLASTSAGTRVLKSVGIAPENPSLRLLFATVVGLGVFTTITLIVGSLITISPWIHWGILIVLLVSGGQTLRSLLLEVGHQGASWLDKRPLIDWAMIFTGAAFIALAVFCAGTPVFDYDTLEYHLGAPGEYYQRGRISHLDHNVYASFPEHVEMLNFTGIILSDSKSVGQKTAIVIQTLFGLLAAFAVGHIAKKLAGQRAILPAALFFLSCPAFIVTILRAHITLARCFYLATALLAVVCWFQSQWSQAASDGKDAEIVSETGPSPYHWVILAGICCGLAAAVKYPAFVLLCLPLGIFVLVTGILHAKGWKERLMPALALTITTCLFVSPWLVRNAIATGNPFFPLLYNTFGGTGWPAHQAAKFSTAHPIGVPSSASGFFRDIWSFLAGFSGNGAPAFASPLILLFIPFLFVRLPSPLSKNRKRLLWFVGGCSLIYIVIWGFATHRIDRFLVPVIVPLAALSAAGFAHLLKSDQARKPAITVMFCVCACAFWIQAVRADTSGGIGGTLSNDSLIDLMQHPAMEFGRAYAEAVDWINSSANVDPSATVMLVGEARTFPFDRNIKYSTVFNDHPLEPALESVPSDLSEAVQKLQNTEVDYVLVNWPEIRRLAYTYRYRYNGRSRQGFLPQVNWASQQPLDRLLRSAGTRVASFGHVSWPDRESSQTVPVIEIYRIQNREDGEATTMSPQDRPQ